MVWRLLGLLSAVTLTAVAPLSAMSEGPQRVLILDSYGRDFAPYGSIASTFRTELAQRSPRPIEFLEVSLETVRFESTEEKEVVDYVRALCARRKVDLVVPNGQPAARFWMQHSDRLLPGVPALLAGVESRHLQRLPRLVDTAAVTVRLDLPALMRHLLRILPDTTNLVVVIGDSPIERFWLSEFRREWAPFEGRVRITYLNEMPFNDVLRQAASLPPRSAIFFILMLQDAAGVPHELTTALDRLHEHANAPIFSWSDDLLGHGIVGGPLLSLPDVGRKAAHAAERILAGDPPGAIEVPITEAGRPMYDWRELRRWHIDTDRLPSGSAILFRPPSILSEYAWVILVSLGLIGAQAFVIIRLLLLHRRNRQAEEEKAKLRRELAHAGRVSIMGELASSLAHELSQPLGAILRNAEAADLFLDQSPPDLEEIRAILEDIRKDDERAGTVIDGIRSMLRQQSAEFRPANLDAIVDNVVTLVKPDAQSRGVALVVDLEHDLPRLVGHQVQLQQVLLNLVLNGMEAMEKSPEGKRTLVIRARVPESGRVELTVSDFGPGIPPEDVSRIFDNFYTTKPGGMGMGLSICRRIVEAHGGRIGARNEPDGGATLSVSLPIAVPAQ
jgi:signal transduction histidine kinase